MKSGDGGFLVRPDVAITILKGRDFPTEESGTHEHTASEIADGILELMDSPLFRFLGRSFSTWPGAGDKDALHEGMLELERRGLAERVFEDDRRVHWQIKEVK